MTVWEDPIVAEVRKVRKEIELECDGSFEKIYARALELQATLGSRLADKATIPLPKAARPADARA